MKLIKLSEFQSISGLSDSMVLLLLKESLLRCHVNQSNELSIDIDAVDLKDLFASLLETHKEQFIEQEPLIIEELGSVMAAHFERIIDEAIARFVANQG